MSLGELVALLVLRSKRLYAAMFNSSQHMLARSEGWGAVSSLQGQKC